MWGGADVWVSEDGLTYQKVGTINGSARHGVLSAALPCGAATDQVNPLAVDLSLSNGVLQSGSMIDVLSLNTLCYVDGEMLAYQTATVTGPNQFSLTYLARGAYGTAIQAHNSGALFARIDNGIFKYPFRADQLTKTIYLKFSSFNLWGGASQDLHALAAYSYTLTGNAEAAALPNVTGISTAFVAGITQISWNPVTDPRAFDYEVRMGASWGSAQSLGRMGTTQMSSCGDGTYWVAAHYTIDNSVDIYSPKPISLLIAGSQLVNNVIATVDEAATGWTGSLNSAVVTTNGIQSMGAGDMRSCANIFVVPDINTYGGITPSAIYTISPAHRIFVNRPVPCNVIMKSTLRGQSITDNVLAVQNIYALTDLCGVSLGPKVSVTPQVQLSQNNTDWTPFQNWQPGSYTAQGFNFRVLLGSSDPGVIPIMSGFSFMVDVPDRQDSLTNLSVPAAGLAVSYLSGLQGNPAAVFNGGPNGSPVPNLQATIVNASQGDDVILTNQRTDGFSVQVFNGGVGVARMVNIIAQGY